MQEPQTIPLWTDKAPGAQGDEDADKPTLTVYMPPDTTGPMAAMVIAPGGGYGVLDLNREGREPANYLNSMGVAAFVLKYRLGPKYRHPVELGDIQRAVRLVRSHSNDWHIAPGRIGVLGFSAGGHLASTVSTHFDFGDPRATDPIDRMSSRPDFAVLVYPVISMKAPLAHQGSKKNLLGEAPADALVESLSSETQVTTNTPPTFLYHTDTDTVVSAENSVQYYLALRKAGVSAELHIFRKGPHGTGMGLQDPALAEWPKLLANWLRAMGILN